MELLHNMWNVLVTEDKNLTNYVCLSLTFVEVYVTMKLFTTVLNICYTKKQRNIYFLCMCVITILSTLFLPDFLNLIVRYYFCTFTDKANF